MVQGTRQREKTMTGAKSSFKIIYEKKWAILAGCYPKSAFLMKSPTFISHKE